MPNLQLWSLTALWGDGDEVEKKVRALRTETADDAAQWNMHQIKLVPDRSYMVQKLSSAQKMLWFCHVIANNIK